MQQSPGKAENYYFWQAKFESKNHKMTLLQILSIKIKIDLMKRLKFANFAPS